MTGDALHNRLTELMNVETNISVEEKGQLANNLCLILRKVQNPQQEIDTSQLFLVLGNGDQSGWTMAFINGPQGIRGMSMSCRHEALHGLRLKVEAEISRIIQLVQVVG